MNSIGDTGMYFLPYKGRKVTIGDIVDIYKNLHVDNGYSIRSAKSGLVLAHATTITLKNCRFYVSESGRQKTIEQKRKRVHAWVRGELTAINQVMDTSFERTIYYNPYVTQHFLDIAANTYIYEEKEIHLEGKYCYAKGTCMGGNVL